LSSFLLLFVRPATRATATQFESFKKFFGEFIGIYLVLFTGQHSCKSFGYHLPAMAHLVYGNQSNPTRAVTLQPHMDHIGKSCESIICFVLAWHNFDDARCWDMQRCRGN